VPKLGDYFAASAFRKRFEAKGRFRAHLSEVPAFVIHAEKPALLGIAQAFELTA
jgi:glucokinase